MTAWSLQDEVWLRAIYPRHPNNVLAKHFRRSAKAIGLKARKMGLRKTPECLAGGQFKPGHATWNKNKSGSTGLHPNCRRTQFKPGSRTGAASRNLRPIGAELTDKDGNVIRKSAIPATAARIGGQSMYWRGKR